MSSAKRGSVSTTQLVLPMKLHIPKGRKTKVPLRDMAIIETAFDRVANHHGGSICYISA